MDQQLVHSGYNEWPNSRELYIRDHEELGFYSQKNITIKPTPNFLHNSLVGLAKPKIVFRVTPNP